MSRFDNKIAIVTGGASGIGREIVRGLHREGAAVVVVDVNAHGIDALVAELGARASGIPADLSDRVAVAGVATTVVERLGGVDLLFNNAGISDQFTAALETTDEQWDSLLSINLNAYFFLSRAVLPSMLSRGGGAIVNTGSVASVVGGGGGAAYTTAKHAILGLTKSLAFSYGPQGVRVNAILPGAIKTAMTEVDEAQVDGADDAILATTAGRWARPEEVAAVALFLGSDDASFVHGSAYAVDGGWTLT